MEEMKLAPRREMTFKRDWTRGSVVRNLLSLSWPVVISESLWGGAMTLDMVWLGRLGAVSLAGVGVAFAMVMLMITVQAGLVTGARAMVARFMGAGDAEGANHVAWQALIITVVYGVVVTLIGFFLAEPLLGLFGLEADVIAEGTAYMRIMFAGWIALALLILVEGVMQASGDTLTPMMIVSSFASIHLLLSPFLTLGWGVFPRLGVSGLALTFVISHGLMAVAGLWVFFTGHTRIRLTLSRFRLDPDILWRIVKIGLPASVMGLQRNLINLVFTRLMAPFGTLAVAAHGMLQRIEMMLRLPSGAISMAASVLVGQNLGARQPERAARNGWLALGFAEGITLVASIAILVWAKSIIGIFSTDPDLVELGGVFLRIAAAGYLVMAFDYVLQRCLSGAGDTLPAMLFSLVDLWVIRLPLAFVLPRVANLGVYGVRWAIVAGMLVAAGAYATYFRIGRWKGKKI